MFPPAEVANIPIIVVGQVAVEGTPVAPSVRSPIDGSHVQLCRARVLVENVLKGDVSPGES